MTLALIRGKTLEGLSGSYRELFTDETSGLITGWGDKKNRVPFYSGVAVFDPRCFLPLSQDAPSEFLPSVLEPLIRAGRVGFDWSESLWFDIGSPELWWQTHFDLKREYQANRLPAEWKSAIDAGISRVRVSEAEGVVDYDAVSSSDRNYIQLETIRYEIPCMGSST